MYQSYQEMYSHFVNVVTNNRAQCDIKGFVKIDGSLSQKLLDHGYRRTARKGVLLNKNRSARVEIKPTFVDNIYKVKIGLSNASLAKYMRG